MGINSTSDVVEFEPDAAVPGIELDIFCFVFNEVFYIIMIPLL
jgi:hypothetical protein